MAKSSGASSIDKYYRKTGFERHKGFFSVLFTLFLLIGVLVSYSAVQQQQVIKSNALVPTSTPIPKVSSTPQLTPNINVDFVMKLSFQGIVSQPTNRKTMDVRVALVGGALQDPKVKQVSFTQENDKIWKGQVTFEGVQMGDGYYLLVKGPKHIQKRICDLVPTESSPGTYSCFKGEITIDAQTEEVNLGGILLMVGDLPDQDGVVDAYDTSLIRNIIAQPSEDRRSEENLSLADLNLDGIVDTQDSSLVVSALSVRSDEE